MYAMSILTRTRSGICEDDCDRDLPTKARRKFTRSHYLRVSWYVNLGQKWKFYVYIFSNAERKRNAERK